MTWGSDVGALGNRNSNIYRESHTDQKTFILGAFQIMVVGGLIMLATALVCGIYFTWKMQNVTNVDTAVEQEYEQHYAFITDDTEQAFWDEVYAGAMAEAEDSDVYVERFGANLTDKYTTQDLLRMAVNSSVDGIIFSGADTAETRDLIQEAVDKGIFVVILRQDMEDSARQCFVGVNSYDLGQEYGKQLLKLENGAIAGKRIFILLDEKSTESRQSIITLAIRDALAEQVGEDQVPDLEVRKIDNSDAFSAEEAIRDIFIDEQNLPDAVVCLNSIFTQCAYQAAVDYTLVGDVQIVGYYSTDSILSAIEKQIIYSTISVDTDEMGRQAVKALVDYRQSGYTNSYVPVNIQVIGEAEAKKLLEVQHE